MKPFVIALAATAALLAAPATAALKVGAKAPDFTTDAAVGTPGAKALGVAVANPKDKAQSFSFTLSKALKKGPGRAVFLPRGLHLGLHGRSA